MKNPNNEKEKVTYSCKGFNVTGDCRKKQCEKGLGLCLQKVSGSSKRPTLKPNSPVTSRPPKILPSKDQKIDKMIVNMGSDGTDDDVKIKICSQDNKVCCESDKLSHFLKSEWVKDKKETWEAEKFGKKCRNQVFKVLCYDTYLN